MLPTNKWFYHFSMSFFKDIWALLVIAIAVITINIGGKYVCLPFMALFYPHESHDSATCCYKLPDKDSVLETLPPLEVTKKELKFKTHPDGTQSHSCWMNIYSNMMTIGFDPYPHCLSSDLPLKTTFPNQSWRFMGVSMVSTCFKMF